MIILLVFVIVYNIVSSAGVSTHQEIVIGTYKNSKSSNKQWSKLFKGMLRSSINHSKRLEVTVKKKPRL